MKEHDRLVQILDHSLDCLDEGTDITSHLTEHPDLEHEITSLLDTRARLGILPGAPRLSAEILAKHRQEFQRAGYSLRLQPVRTSSSLFRRYIERLFPASRQYYRRLSHGLLVVTFVLLMFAGLLAATATTMLASMPDSPLYTLKLAIEDFELNLATTSTQRAQLAMRYAGERTREIRQMAQWGKPVNESVSERLQEELNTALKNMEITDGDAQLRIITEEYNVIMTQREALAEDDMNGLVLNHELIRLTEKQWEQVRVQVRVMLGLGGASMPDTVPPNVPTPVPTRLDIVTPTPSSTLNPTAIPTYSVRSPTRVVTTPEPAALASPTHVIQASASAPPRQNRQPTTQPVSTSSQAYRPTDSGISNNVGIKRILCLVSCNALTLCASNPTGEVNTMQNILGFLVSTPGRAIRLIVGAGMIVYGLFLAGSIIGYGIAAIGLVVFAITAGDGCIFGSSRKAS